jgi:DNA-binding NarL/FixJ family response regulator
MAYTAKRTEHVAVSCNDLGSVGPESHGPCRRVAISMREAQGTDGERAAQDIDMPQASKIKVLIAHSDPLISAGLAATLKRDFEIMVCSSALAPSHSPASPVPSPDVVVADYDSGIGLIASEACTDRVVILTHCDSEVKICHALEQGARGYLLLGCSLKDLMDALRSVHVGGIALGPIVASRVADRMKLKALTGRERDILRQLMLGLCNKSIAANLALAVGTVKTHVKSILRKLEAATRTEAVAVAHRRGIMPEEREWPSTRVRKSGSGERSSLTKPYGVSSRARFGSRWRTASLPVAPPVCRFDRSIDLHQRQPCVVEKSLPAAVSSTP